MITKSDRKIYREELKKEIIKLRVEFIKAFEPKEKHKKDIDRVIEYVNLRFEAIEEIYQFRKEFKEFKESVLKTLDFLVGAYKKFDDEYFLISHQLLNVDKILGKHETRITRLEEKNRKKPS